MLEPTTATIQSEVARYCRTGHMPEVPGANQERLKEYRRLVVNIFHDTLEQAFPITVQLLTEDSWETIVNTFIAEHNCQTNYIWKLPFEFYEFVVARNFQETFGHPFLNELIYFEWMEIEIHTMPDIEIPPHDEEGDFFEDILLINPEHEILKLTYPVHLYNAMEASKHPGTYFVVIFRAPEDGSVRFLNVSVLLAYVIEQLHESNISLKPLLKDISEIFNIPNDLVLQEHILQFLQDLKLQKMVLGFKKNN